MKNSEKIAAIKKSAEWHKVRHENLKNSDNPQSKELAIYTKGFLDACEACLYLLEHNSTAML